MRVATALPHSRLHQVEAGIDAGSRAGAGDQVSVVDEEHIRIHPRGRVAPSEFGGVAPMGRARASVKQAGRPQGEGA